MSRHDTRELADVKVVMLKGEKGEKGDGSYDDTAIRQLINDESNARINADASLESEYGTVSRQVSYLDTHVNSVDSELTQRIDALASNSEGYVIDELWSGEIYAGGSVANLAHPITNYDYLDFYAYVAGDVACYTVEARTGNLFIRDSNLTDDTGTALFIYELKCVIAEQSISIGFNHAWRWSGSSSASASKSTDDSGCKILKIVGRKCKSDFENAELADLRIGTDGTVYGTAGTAVRTQLDLLDEKIEFGNTQEYINEWLNEHPEAVTTVQDGSITESKLASSLRPMLISEYVTPEMYGAIGDGETDDSTAIQNALDSEKVVLFDDKTYAIGQSITLPKSVRLSENTVIKAINEMDSVFSASNKGDTFRFIGGVIDCNSLAGTGITLTSCNGAYIQNAKVLNATEASVKITGGHHNWVTGCKLYNKATLATGIDNTSPDLKVCETEIYYTECGINNSSGILFVANSHLWSGGADNPSTTSVGIRHTSSNPRLFLSGVYFDSFYIGVDASLYTGEVNASSCLWYWALTTTPQSCYGIKLHTGATWSLEACKFQTFSPIQKTDILYGDKGFSYTGNTFEATSEFNVTSNATVTIFKSVVSNHELYIDFVINIAGVTTDSTNWIPVIESISNPSLWMNTDRRDFTCFNQTTGVAVLARVGRYTANNIIKIHIMSGVAVGDRVYGSISMPLM